MVVNLPNDAKDVASVELNNLLVAVVFRSTLAHLEAADAGNADRVAQEGERTVLTGEVLQSIEKNGLPVVRFLQKPKFLRIRRLLRIMPMHQEYWKKEVQTNGSQ